MGDSADNYTAKDIIGLSGPTAGAREKKQNKAPENVDVIGKMHLIRVKRRTI
ncbi:MAG: hypothetical protein QW644_02675 [Candidatus Micrarchaeaceae archaeon]